MVNGLASRPRGRLSGMDALATLRSIATRAYRARCERAIIRATSARESKQAAFDTPLIGAAAISNDGVLCQPLCDCSHSKPAVHPASSRVGNAPADFTSQCRNCCGVHAPSHSEA